MSTKAIHHHGDMLLTTATAFGTGYEHWTFETPTVVDAEREIYELKVLEQAPHPLHHVAFVDAYIAHLPLYPPDLTITYALWSSQFPTTWKDKLKRQPLFAAKQQTVARSGGENRSDETTRIKSRRIFRLFPESARFLRHQSPRRIRANKQRRLSGEPFSYYTGNRK